MSAVYTQFLEQVGDQWVAAIKQVEEGLVAIAENTQKAAPTVDLPSLPAIDPFASYNEALAQQLPKPSEVVKANFDLSQRVLVAQRDLALRLVGVGAEVDAPRSSASGAATAEV
jgi:hypothetical protein